ncbi:hypothetical protein [Halanaerobaculum tunisiense]
MVDFKSGQWLSGFISGTIATIIGFIFTMIWDIYKFRRDQKSREENIVSAFKRELNDNLEFLQHNKILLSKELEVIENDKSIVAPLIILQNDFWELMKINLPKILAKEDMLVKVKRVVRGIIQLNEQIKSREDYRINNQGYTNYNSRMKKYDETMIVITEQLYNDIEELLKDINKANESYIKKIFYKTKSKLINLCLLIKRKLKL